jgi:16S rRNA (guanine(966)-N(2))-methyltransferase RsmD
MRIVSGIYKGRRLHPPVNLPVRPTTDFAKEGLFNVLNNDVDYTTLRVLDLFTGTGSIAFEFLSRGVLEVTAVDSNHRCIEFVKTTAAAFGATNLRVVKSNCFVFIKRMVASYDLIFADPPYDLHDLTSLPDLVLCSGLLAENGLFILEHSAEYSFAEHANFTSQRHYGSVNFSFFNIKAKG